MSDDLDDVLAGKEPEQPEQVEAPEQEQPQEQATEEAAQAEPEQPEEPEQAAEPAPEKPEADDKQHTVPASVVAELRRELRELKQQQPARQPEPLPDVTKDPQGFQRQMATMLDQQSTKVKLEMSRAMAEREFGADEVQAAYDYFDQHPEQSQALINEASPFHKAVEVYRQQKMLSEVGPDPSKWAEQERARIRAEVEAELAAKQVKEAAAKPAPSMANVTGGGGQQSPGWSGPVDLDSLLS